MTSAHRVLPSFLVAAVLTAACGGDAGETEGDGWTGTVTDSAGVRLVTNPATGLWGAHSPWSLVEEMRIGGLDAPPAAIFGAVVGIDVDLQGRIYVADQQSSEIRVFDGDGTHLRTIGRQGSGPGELGGEFPGLFVDAGVVRVVDMGNLRVTRFDLDGTHLGSTPIDVSRGIPLRWDRDATGRIVVQLRSAGTDVGADLAGGDQVRTFADSSVLFTLPRGSSLVMEEGAGPPRFRLFEPEPVWDFGSSGRFVSGTTDAYRIEVRDGGGSLQQVIGRPHRHRPVSEPDRALLRDAFARFLEGQGVPPRAIGQFVAGVQFADFYPAFARILVAPDNMVWVQRMKTAAALQGASDFDPGDLGSREWDLFDDEGRYLGVLPLPARFQPIRLVGDAVYGVQDDEFGVQAVVVLRLLRS